MTDSTELVKEATRRAKKAIRLYGEPFLADTRTLFHNGVTVVWKNDYNDGVFKIILRGLWHRPLHLVRVRWVNGRTTTDYDEKNLIEGLKIVMQSLDHLMVLDDLANV